LATTRETRKLARNLLRLGATDEKGTPFALCGALCKSNGYDERKRVFFVCGK